MKRKHTQQQSENSNSVAGQSRDQGRSHFDKIFGMALALALSGAKMLADSPQTPGSEPDLADASQAAVVHGRNLFIKETFDGNGRTCMSCHTLPSGTIS